MKLSGSFRFLENIRDKIERAVVELTVERKKGSNTERFKIHTLSLTL